MKKKKIKKLIDKRIVEVVSTLLKNYNVPCDNNNVIVQKENNVIVKGFKKEE